MENDLFQQVDGGAIPTSPLQMRVELIKQRTALDLNMKWHSKLPVIKNYWYCKCFGAFFNHQIFAVAMWSIPVATKLNNMGMYEMRRMAISPEAPKNTASWMLSRMRILIHKMKPQIKTLISYQDTS